MKTNAPEKFAIDDLRALLRHDPATGFLFWREGRMAGRRALASRRRSGHLGGNIAGKFIFSHIAIWALHFGRWPEGEIDHVDGDPANNLLSNLRDVSHAENMRNQRLRKGTGRVGVRREKRCDRWWAEIGDKKYLGMFRTYEEACAAREAAERELGYHENHGRVA